MAELAVSSGRFFPGVGRLAGILPGAGMQAHVSAILSGIMVRALRAQLSLLQGTAFPGESRFSADIEILFRNLGS